MPIAEAKELNIPLKQHKWNRWQELPKIEREKWTGISKEVHATTPGKARWAKHGRRAATLRHSARRHAAMMTRSVERLSRSAGRQPRGAATQLAQTAQCNGHRPNCARTSGVDRGGRATP